MIGLLKKYWLSALVITIILVLCFMNPKSLPASPMQNFDKVVHTLMFLGLAAVIFFDNTSYLRFSISKLRIFLGTFLFPVAFGGLIEIMQRYLTKTRSGEWFDFLADAVGVFFAMGVALLINRYFLMKKVA